MMDEMKMKLSSKFMRGMASKLIAKAIYKKYGCKVKIHIDDLDISMINGETSIKVNAEANLSSDEFMKIVKGVDLD